ncbi:DUF4433 domain-containing protein [Maioricimonas sp. JC845]|uniref:type II toxin-antitoxin system toxin DNA ADP-ribosyl transferase DarT n=1 Tax=Maioricimonas sp. JC845 TaxID=3232138 RepID=UPI0034581B01
MSSIPPHPKIYHITHSRNLPLIAQAGALWSDARRVRERLVNELVGMAEIKRRRMQELQVTCHPGIMVGDCVPFYFCPRSVMLYILHRANHPELDYRGGQRPIVHLQADLQKVLEQADADGVRWAFSDRNAAARFAKFYNRREDLKQLDWTAISATDFRELTIQEAKQAEFLVHDSFPWSLVEKIGVIDRQTETYVRELLAPADHVPDVAVERGWYF